MHAAGDFNWQRAARTALVSNNMKWLLPLTDMMKRPEGPVDPFAVIGGEGKVYSLLRDALSPLHLSAVGVYSFDTSRNGSFLFCSAAEVFVKADSHPV
jgi:hypothetical protein